MLPKDWNQATLESLCHAPITYGVLKPGEYCTNGTPLLQIKDLLGNLDNQENIHRISDELDFEYRRSKIQVNDILISLVGTVGRIAIVPASLDGANIHRNIARIRTKNYEFLVHYLNSDVAKNRIGLSSSGSSQSALNLSVLRALKVPVPPLPEQQKIAKILSTWDNAISATKRLLENSQQRKKALMQQLLTGKKRLPGFEGEWEERVVGDDFDVRSSKRVLQEDWKTEGIPFFRTRELVSLSKNEPFRSEIFISEKLYEEISKKYGTPKEGDFLVSGVGTLGISYQVKARDVFYFKDGNVLWFKTKNMINSDFFNYCFHSVYFQNQINAQAAITTVGTFTIQNAKKIKFFCPPTLDEQRKIATILTTADQEIDALQKRLGHLKLEKKALMQQLLTGKRRVVVDADAA